MLFRSTLEDRIVALIDNIINQLQENPIILRFISKNLSWAVFSSIQIEELDNRNCMDIFQDLLKESGRRFRNENLMIFMIVELVNATCYNAILIGQPSTMEELKPELITAVCNIIGQFECK